MLHLRNAVLQVLFKVNQCLLNPNPPWGTDRRYSGEPPPASMPLRRLRRRSDGYEGGDERGSEHRKQLDSRGSVSPGLVNGSSQAR
jgi:hypothetical protein